MNVLNIFYNFNQGGVERLGITVANNMARNHENSIHVCIITKNYSSILLEKFSSNVKILFLKRSRLFRKLSYAAQISLYIKKNNIKIVHVHQGELMPLYVIVKLICPNIKLFFTIHDSYIFSELSKSNQFLAKLCCKKLIAISEAVVKDILANGVNKEKIVRIYNGVDFSIFDSQEIHKSSNKDIVRITNVARFFPKKKGQDILIEAAKLLKEEKVNFVITFAGAEPVGAEGEMERMKQLAKKHGLKNIEFLGNVDNVPALLSKTDVFCIPSRYEGFGISAVEAMAMGIPCVASNIPGLNEVVNASELGELFEVGNPESLAEKLKKVVLDFEKYNSQKIREDAYNRFSIETMVKQLEAVYGGK